MPFDEQRSDWRFTGYTFSQRDAWEERWRDAERNEAEGVAQDIRLVNALPWLGQVKTRTGGFADVPSEPLDAVPGVHKEVQR